MSQTGGRLQGEVSVYNEKRVERGPVGSSDSWIPLCQCDHLLNVSEYTSGILKGESKNTLHSGSHKVEVEIYSIVWYTLYDL